MNRPEAPWPVETRTRRCHPISPEQLAAIMSEVRPRHPVSTPVPTYQAAAIFIGLLAGAIVGWVLLYGAAVLVRALAS